MIELILQFFLLAVLFVASAFFSGSETALFSLSRLDLRRIRRERNPQSDTLHELLDQPRRLIISVLCGNQAVNVAATAVLTAALVTIYGVEKAAWISTVVMVPLLLLFSEATPKTIAISNPIRVSTKIVARPMHFWVHLIAPVASIVRRVSDRITTRIVGEETAPDNILQVDEFRSLLDEGVVSGDLTATERALIHNLLQAGSTEIIEVMVPRTRVNWINGDASMTEIREAFMRFRHQRVPVYRKHRDNVIGFLCAEDMLQTLLEDIDPDSLKLEDLLRPVPMVPSTKKVDEMFDYFQTHDLQAVIVLNEFGGVDGLLTINDVLTCIFGQPPTDIEQSPVDYDPASDTYELPGDMKLIDVNQLTNLALQDTRMTTIGGLILRQLDRLPVAGDLVSINGIQMEVLEMDGYRVAKARLHRNPEKGRSAS
jgi:CBS domain containing-hemolysin-like protein